MIGAYAPSAVTTGANLIASGLVGAKVLYALVELPRLVSGELSWKAPLFAGGVVLVIHFFLNILVLLEVLRHAEHLLAQLLWAARSHYLAGVSSLFLVRHAQASMGAEDYDNLSEHGIEQSTRLGRAFV